MHLENERAVRHISAIFFSKQRLQSKGIGANLQVGMYVSPESIYFMLCLRAKRKAEVSRMQCLGCSNRNKDLNKMLMLMDYRNSS